MAETEDPRAAFIDAALWHGQLDPAESILAAHPESAQLTLASALCLGRMDDAARMARDASAGERHIALMNSPTGWEHLK